MRSYKKSDKSKQYKLHSIGYKVKDVIKLGQQLISNLGDSVFVYPTRTELLYNILKQISPINKILTHDDASIEIACEKVMKQIGLKEGTIYVSTDAGWGKIKHEEKSNTEKFCQIVIEMDKAPAHAYEELLSKVNRDLLAITELINWYEEQPCIRKYIKENEVPKIHEDRIIYDFYKRCIDERVKIFNYQLFGIKERAIEKSKYQHLWSGIAFDFSEMFRDRPYYFAYPYSIHYFDCKKIDLAGHRIRNLTFREGEKMQQLYLTDAVKFYKLYFKRISIQQHFQNFSFYLSYLPLKNNRNLIFDELVKSFKAKRWISFYALALPQVEGLFSEMCLAIAPENDLSQKSLTHKVNSVRPFHDFSTSYFDYYQYHIPLQRNKFSHTGYDEDFKLKSYDLLIDLSYLLEVFYELNNPLVKVRKIHLRRDFKDFITIKEFVEYFKLINDLKPQQKKDLQNDIDKFEKEFLNQYCSIDYTCYQMIQDLPVRLKELSDAINASFDARKISMDFDKLKFPELKKLLEHKESLEVFENNFSYEKEIIKRLNSYKIFISSYKKHLPNLEPTVEAELSKVDKIYGSILKNISAIEQQLNKSTDLGR